MSNYPCNMMGCTSSMKITEGVSKNFRYICRNHTDKEIYAQFPDIAAEHAGKERQDVKVRFQTYQFDKELGGSSPAIDGSADDDPADHFSEGTNHNNAPAFQVGQE